VKINYNIQATPEETARVFAERDYWREFGNPLGWKVYCWTYRDHCVFVDSKGKLFGLKGYQRDEIIAAFRKVSNSTAKAGGF
jgi:hypothetical protein